MNSAVISALRTDLRQQADEKTRNGYTRYFKEKVTYYGVKSAAVSRIGKKYFRAIKHLSKNEVFGLCEELLESDYTEEALIACDWAYNLRGQYETGDFARFESWLNKYINNWAKCDTLCNHTVGALVARYPQYLENLKQWARSENRWLRRASAVTLIIPAKEGQFLKEILQIAGILLLDEDDLVQKGYGWLLKEASWRHQPEIFDYVMANRKVMPRTALRYAIEKMPEELKRRAMEKS